MVYDKNGSGHHSVSPPLLPFGGNGGTPTKTTIVDRTLNYRFHTHFHPYVHELVRELIEKSVRGLQAADTEIDPHEQLFTADQYDPSNLVLNTEDEPHPVKDLDFTSGGAYSAYNWELFFHAPLVIAIHLSRNQRFEEAQRWFHYIFDPTDTSTGPTPERFWKVKPFRTTDVQSIEQILVNLATNADPKLRDETINSIGAWQDAPFRPHLVARYRQSAYMVKTVMAYLDNLIDWGDALFRQDTGESINEATQIYVLAANILGPQPQPVPRKGWHRPQTYADLRGDLDAFGNAMREVEVDIPFDLAPHPQQGADDAGLSTVHGLGSALYFCVPRNDKLIGYWDTVADRLFKIRNSLNIQGVFRQLPLFEPPIDPALLAKATAAGVDIAAVISGANQPLPLVRFSFLIGKALEICQEVKALGSHLLSAIEKEDGEALLALRARHERIVLGLAETVRDQQRTEARKATEGIKASWISAKARYRYYERLLGRTDADIDKAVQQLDELDVTAVQDAAEPAVAPRPLDVDIAADLARTGGRLMSSFEAAELAELEAARDQRRGAGFANALGAELSILPNISMQAEPLGVGGSVSFGGSNLAAMASLEAGRHNEAAEERTYQANLNAKISAFQRREQEWAYQSNVAASELTQIYKQWRAAQIREALAEREYQNHLRQIEHAKDIERFLTDAKTGKTTGQAFYAWLRREVRGLYSQCFQFAFEVARKAERALHHELGATDQSFLRFDYQSGRQSMLAGEKLYLDLKRMELAYHEQNQREYELTKHVSLRQLGLPLLQLRATGSTIVSLPEELFDLDCPGHYFRRIRSVAVSVPCVVGPYASVNCTLTLQKSTIRTSSALGADGYPRVGEDPSRFADHFGTVQAIVTSSASNDGGLFEAGQRDERYLPFEGAGAVSQWRLELPANVPQFDRSTITDVVLHVRYTAREGGLPLRKAAEKNLVGHINTGTAPGSVRLLSVRQDFPSDWAKFCAASLSGQPATAPLTLTLRPEHYPFWATKLGAVALLRVSLFAQPGKKGSVDVYGQQSDSPVTLNADPSYEDPLSESKLLTGDIAHTAVPATGQVTLRLTDNTVPDLWIALTWLSGP